MLGDVFGSHVRVALLETSRDIDTGKPASPPWKLMAKLGGRGTHKHISHTREEVVNFKTVTKCAREKNSTGVEGSGEMWRGSH